MARQAMLLRQSGTALDVSPWGGDDIQINVVATRGPSTLLVEEGRPGWSRVATLRSSLGRQPEDGAATAVAPIAVSTPSCSSTVEIAGAVSE